MRCSGGTNFGLVESVVVPTKSTIACFAGPSFHEASTLPGGAVCACAEAVRSAPDRVGSAANVESKVRRSIPNRASFDVMMLSPWIDQAGENARGLVFGWIDLNRSILEPGVSNSGLVQQASAHGPDARLLKVRLLSFVIFHHLLDLLLDLGEVEGRGLLHRRIVDERLCRRCHGLLHLDETPAFARHEVVHVAAPLVVERLAADRRRALE